MRKVIFFALILLIPLHSMGNTILVLGDSISAAYGIPRESGWVVLLQKRLDERYPGQFRVVNASVSGETTAGGLLRLPPLLDEFEPVLVIVELGGNDGLRGMPLQEMEKNLLGMVDLIQGEGSEVMLLSVKLPASYGVFFNRKFEQVFSSVENSRQVSHVSLGFDSLNDQNLLQEDGIHPTSEAQPLLFNLIWSKLESLIQTGTKVPS